MCAVGPVGDGLNMGKRVAFQQTWTEVIWLFGHPLPILNVNPDTHDRLEKADTHGR